MSASRVTSHSTKVPSTIFATRLPPAVSMSATTTRAPSAAKRVAIPSPMPLAAPVMTAVWPSSRPIAPRLRGPPHLRLVAAFGDHPEPRHLVDVDEPQVPLVSFGRPADLSPEGLAVTVADVPGTDGDRA